MLGEIIRNLKEIMPDAFLDKKPSIPWMDGETRTLLSERRPEDRNRGPSTVWIDPEYLPTEDDPGISEDINKIGTEALAWYISFHQSRKWGIYFRLRGLGYLAGFFMTRRPAAEPNENIKRAYDMLFHHEFFHFLTDMTAVHMEMVYRKPIYNNYLSYLVHMLTRYGSVSNDFQVEEPLANAYALQRTQRRYYSCVKDLFSRQPLPYCNYGEFASDTKFLEGKRKLGAILRIHDENLVFAEAGVFNKIPEVTEPPWEFLYNVAPEKLFLPEIPVWFVIEKDHPTSSIKFVTPVFMGTRIAAYPCDHPPPHLHIWLPADNRRDGRYLYPSLQPYMNAKPLSNRERKKVEEVIAKFKDKIERDLVEYKRRAS